MVKNSYELSKKLSAENSKIFTDIVCYLRTSSLDEFQAEESIQDILDMLFSAQQRGEPISNVIGPDYKQFCDNIIENSLKQKFSILSILSILELLLISATIIFLCDVTLNVIPVAIKSKSFITDYIVTSGLVLRTIVALVIAYVIVEFIGRNSFKLSEKSKSHKFVICTLLGLLIVLPGVLSYYFGKHILLSTKIYYVALILILSFLATKLIKKIVKV